VFVREKERKGERERERESGKGPFVCRSSAVASLPDPPAVPCLTYKSTEKGKKGQM
jgi:hypothetical protein